VIDARAALGAKEAFNLPSAVGRSHEPFGGARNQAKVPSWTTRLIPNALPDCRWHSLQWHTTTRNVPTEIAAGGRYIAPITAWLRYWVNGDKGAKDFFFGGNCKVCTNPWITPETNDMWKALKP
jgi:hypothetical protein